MMLQKFTQDSPKNVPSSIFAQNLSQKPRNIGIDLEFVEKENLTEIYILTTDFNSSFASLITVRYKWCSCQLHTDLPT